jgi:hypothetical protein
MPAQFPAGARPLDGASRSPAGAPSSTTAPQPLRVAGSVARWWWPTLAVAGFLAVVAYVTGHDHPGPSPSNRGLLTIALAAVVIVLLTIHRSAGLRPLARAVAEYTVVASSPPYWPSPAASTSGPPTRPAQSPRPSRPLPTSPTSTPARTAVLECCGSRPAWLA